MFNPGPTKAFMATANAAPYSIAAFGANDHECALATSAANSVLGVYTEVGAKVGLHADVVVEGTPGVKLAGPVTRGALVTTNASGLGVAAASGNRVVGQARQTGVAGDVIPVLLTIGAVAPA